MWFELEVTGPKKYRVHLKWWHPKCWRYSYRLLRRHGVGRLESVYLTLKMVRALVK